MRKYLVIVEKTASGYSSYSPDLAGCIATGKTKAEVEKTMQEAIELHLKGMQEDGLFAPTPHSYPTYCEDFA